MNAVWIFKVTEMKREKVKHYYPDQFTPWNWNAVYFGNGQKSKMKVAMMTNAIILKPIHID